MIVVNFKNYKIGKPALKLVKKIQKHFPKAIVAVNSVDIEVLSKKSTLRIFAEHIDSNTSNKSTGFLTVESAKKSGAKGSLLNHSEHNLNLDEIKTTLILANKQKLKIILCASSLKQIKNFKKLKPWAIAYEEPKLVGTGKSITEYNSENIKKFVGLLKKTKIIPLCGAGISSGKDYKQATLFGCKGILISSAIVKSKNPDKILKNLKNEKEN